MFEQAAAWWVRGRGVRSRAEETGEECGEGREGREEGGKEVQEV